MVVSETGHISREPQDDQEAQQAPAQRAPVGADGRPVTSAGSLLAGKCLGGGVPGGLTHMRAGGGAGGGGGEGGVGGGREGGVERTCV